MAGDLIGDHITCRRGISVGVTTRGTAHIGTVAAGEHGGQPILGTLAAAVTQCITQQHITKHGTDHILTNIGVATMATSEAEAGHRQVVFKLQAPAGEAARPQVQSGQMTTNKQTA